MLQLTEFLKLLFIETANNLKGHERRRFMALTVKELGKGGQRLAERELGWGTSKNSNLIENSFVKLMLSSLTYSQ